MTLNILIDIIYINYKEIFVILTALCAMIGISMNIFVSLDSNYIHPLCVMLRSLAATNNGNSFDIYVEGVNAERSATSMTKITVQDFVLNYNNDVENKLNTEYR